MAQVLVRLVLLAASSAAFANDFPTLERVDHVLTCMRLNGGQTVDNLYSCSCEIDTIAQQLSFDDYSEARTYEVYKRMPGERGELFRGGERGKEMTAKLAAARADAHKRCFIGGRVKGSRSVKDGIAPAPAAPAEQPAAAPAQPEGAAAGATSGGQ